MRIYFMVYNARITLACEVDYEKAKYHTTPNVQCVRNKKNIKTFNKISINVLLFNSNY